MNRAYISLIRGLREKKNRLETGFFMAEGKKIVKEMLFSHFSLEMMFLLENSDFLKNDIDKIPRDKISIIDEKYLSRISLLKTPDTVLAIFKIPSDKEISIGNNELILALDGINNPSNLGAIIRVCDWFGIKKILCSENTVDVYNPKVIQSSMASIIRVDVHYTNLLEFLSDKKEDVFISSLDGENIYNAKLPSSGILIMGNESVGVSKDLSRLSNNRVSIPKFGMKKIDSLNVAVATGILLSEFRRKNN
ncbi:TrmH family RNA methyltransferase [Ichthyobacterium seriolicida]|uniref:RNA methyltransferase, TrmH family n=1 Tax=Ichthyobacterium seriolicida TaxID=242600 RepID=A0A1J1DW62_9FLAO|nr:RNA methyltransferase [Ichthyobacterium seriolicida]BAV94103.1 RNA methyltransferase, TrmH family [Ichthyobacterium seriolicida]